ncbi:hypothetical protein, partial [Angustibacter peucedani]
APVTPGDRLAAALHRVREAGQGTPGRMRLVSAGLVLVSLLLGLGAAQSFRAAQGALDRADANAAQLVRLTDLRTSLVRADADATNAFLVGGLEPADQRADYDTAVQRAAATLARAARSQPADVDALAALNRSVQSYTGLVELARANNRQGLPLGAQYLRDASAGLRSDALPLLESLTRANQDRVQAEFTHARQAVAALVLTGLLALAAVVVASLWLSRRTHRYLNVPLVAAGAVVLVTLVAGGVALGDIASTVGAVRDGPYSQARALSEARVAAFDAKANESLTLISRGSGAAFEATWKESAGTTSAQLGRTPDLQGVWTTYTQGHTAIRALDDGGQWDRAVAAATDRSDGSTNAAFAQFDEQSQTALDQASSSTSRRLLDAGSGLGLATWLAVLAGLAAAVLAWWGLAQRIEEYR